MIIPKLVSSREAVEQFYSNTGTQSELNDDDIRLWTAELCDLLKLPLSYIPKVIGHKQNSAYDFTNFTVPLPCDFQSLIPGGIAVNGNPVRWRQNSFHYLMGGDCCDLANLNTSMDIFVDQFGNEFSPQASVNPNLAPLYQDITFDITDNRIVFNVREGKVCMAYWAIPIDPDGYVMIPDTAKFKRAVADYLTWKNDYILWRQGTLPKDVYIESRNNKEFSIAAAASEIKVPDVEQQESMKNSIVRLLPKVNSYNHFFKDLGTQEQRRMK
jgi:hypothetical protein